MLPLLSSLLLPSFSLPIDGTAAAAAAEDNESIVQSSFENGEADDASFSPSFLIWPQCVVAPPLTADAAAAACAFTSLSPADDAGAGLAASVCPLAPPSAA